MIGQVTRAPAGPIPDRLQRRARRHEARVIATAHPVGWLLNRLALLRPRDLWRVPGLGYVACDAELIRAILVDSERFRKDGDASSSAAMTQIMGPLALFNMEGAEHAGLRRRLHALFSEEALDELEVDPIQPLVHELADRLAQGVDVDVAAFGRLLTGATMCRLNGLTLQGPARARQSLRFFEIASRIVGLVGLRMKPLSAPALTEARALFDELVAPVEEAWAAGGDRTIPGRLRGMGLDCAESRGVVGMLLIAGMETTSTALSRLVAILSDLEYWDRIEGDGGGPNATALDAVIDEGLRLITPVPAVSRTVAEDCVVNGHRLRGGRLILSLLHSAARDPRVIERGDEFVPERPIPRSLRHLWFGAGPHFCLGAALARRQLRTTIRAVAGVAGGAGAGITVVERRAARRVLLPAYDRLAIRA